MKKIEPLDVVFYSAITLYMMGLLLAVALLLLIMFGVNCFPASLNDVGLIRHVLAHGCTVN